MKRAKADFAAITIEYIREKKPPLFYLLEFEQNVSHTATLYSQYIQSGEETKKGYHLSKPDTQAYDKSAKAGSWH